MGCSWLERASRLVRREGWPVSAALVILVTLLHLFLNGTNIDHRELWEDEASTYQLAQLPLHELVPATIDLHSQPPLYYVLLRGLTRITSELWVLRGLSWFCCLLLMYLVLLEARELALTARLAFVLLFCFNGFTTYLAHELRPYALAALLGLASTMFLLRLVRQPASRRWFWAYLLTAMAMAYTLALNAWVLATHGLFVLWHLAAHWRRAGLRATLRSQWPVIVALAVVCLAYLPYVMAATHYYDKWYGHLPSRRSLGRSLDAAFTFEHYRAAFDRFAHVRPPFSIVALAMLLLATFSAIARRNASILLWLLLAVGHVGFVHGFLAGRSFYAERYLTPAFPAFCWLVALGIDRLVRHPPALWWPAVVAALSLSALGAGASYMRYLDAPLPQHFWRNQHAMLAKVPGRKVVFFDTGWLGQMLSYAARDDRSLVVLHDRLRFWPPERMIDPRRLDPQFVSKEIDRRLPRTDCYFYYRDGMTMGRAFKGANSPYFSRFLPAMQRHGLTKVLDRRIRSPKGDMWDIAGYCRGPARAR